MPAPMPLEFALRPRFRLDESVAPPRRSRPKLPRALLPIAGYWLGMAVLTHALIIAAKSEDTEQGQSFEPQEQAFLAPPAPAPEIEQPAFEPVPAPEPAPEPAPAPVEMPPEEPIAHEPLEPPQPPQHE